MPERTRHRHRSEAPSPTPASSNNGRTTVSFSTTQRMADELKAWARRRNTSVSQLVNESISTQLQTQLVRSKWENLDDDDDTVNPQKFFTASDDKQGHSAQIRLYIPKHFAGIIKRVVDSKVIPEYRSNADFYRDALIHRAMQVADWIDSGALNEVVDLMVMMSEEAAIAEERQEMQNLVRAMEDNIDQLLQSGHLDYLERYLQDKWDRRNNLPELHRDAYTNVIRKARGKLEMARKGL